MYIIKVDNYKFRNMYCLNLHHFCLYKTSYDITNNDLINLKKNRLSNDIYSLKK